MIDDLDRGANCSCSKSFIVDVIGVITDRLKLVDMDCFMRVNLMWIERIRLSVH
jgi:hypothetical protein